MGYRYVVLGAGRQGVALAYDLVRNCEADRLVLADIDPELARHGLARVQSLLPDKHCELAAVICDVSKPAEAAMTMSGADVVISAVPYRFNAALTDAAIAAQASFCDLGGNTLVVQQQLKRHERAVAAGVAILPDCGLAPGLCNILAAHGVSLLDQPEHAHIRCGGLPEEPVGPLGYKMTFNFDGLINEYSGFGDFLRDGQRVQIPALTEIEPIEFPAPVGKCEAAVTSGGVSTCADTFAGRLQSYDYKTVRYPGHFTAIRAMAELGCFDEVVNLPGDETLEPRPLIRRLFEQKLSFPDVRDLIVLRCTVSGRHQGQPRTLSFDLLDRHDPETDFSAMERMTAFPTALVAYMLARRLVAPGVRPLETALPTQQYLDELAAHDVHVTTSKT